MATKICAATGNFTGAIWATVDATSFLDSQANNTLLTTTYVESQASAPGAITIDGIAVKVATRAAVPSGTISIRLATGGVLVAGTEVTINVSDLIATALLKNGWIFFAFTAPVLLVAATNYTVSARTSAASQVNLYRNATAGNWSRMLRTTTVGTLGAADDFFVLGEWTAAATKTNRVVTMDSTAATDYGSAVAGSTAVAGAGVGNGGTVIWGTTAATAYVLRLSTNLDIWAGGIWQMGTVATPCPVDASMQLEFDCAADNDFNLRCYSTAVLTLQGTRPTTVIGCLLNTDEAIAQTVLGVDAATGWLSGDEIVIESTTRTTTQAELRTLSINAGASTVTVTAGLTFAHSGTSPVQAAVVMITRNVRIKAVTSTFNARMFTDAESVFDWDWASTQYMPTSSGCDLPWAATSAGSFNAAHCVFRDGEGGFNVTVDEALFAFTNCIFYNQGNTSASPCLSWSTGHSRTAASAWVITGCYFILFGTSSNSLNFRGLTGTFTNNRLSSGTAPVSLVGTDGEPGNAFGTFANNVFHSWSGQILTMTQNRGLIIDTCSFWRSSGVGLGIEGSFDGLHDVLINNCTFFGHLTAGLRVSSSSGVVRDPIIRNCLFAGESTFAQPIGLDVGTADGVTIRVQNCTFGVVSGIFVAHTTGDVGLAANDTCCELILNNCLLASATEVANRTSMTGRGVIRYQRKDQVTGVHQSDYPALGTVTYDAAVFRTAAPSERLSPTAAITPLRLRSTIFRAPVASGRVVTFSLYVRKTAAYDGVQPRLILRANPSLGIDDDVIVKTMVGAADTWEQLSGAATAAEEDGVTEWYVDCTGSAGSVYVDDASASSST